MTNASAFRELQNVTTQLCRNEFIDIDRRYGSVDKPGGLWLPYHNVTHAQQVHDFGFKIAQVLERQGRIEARDVYAVRVAGAYHDHDQLEGSGDNERRSAAIAIRDMDRHPAVFRQQDKANVGSMIEGTITSVSSDGRLVQQARQMGLLEAVVADADLAVLGTELGPSMALNLFLEQQSMQGKLQLPSSARDLRSLQPDPNDLSAFYRFQDRLLANHEYILDVSREMFGPGLEPHREFNTAMMQLNEAGAPFSAQLDLARGFAKNLDTGRGLA